MKQIAMTFLVVLLAALSSEAKASQQESQWCHREGNITMVPVVMTAKCVPARPTSGSRTCQFSNYRTPTLGSEFIIRLVEHEMQNVWRVALVGVVLRNPPTLLDAEDYGESWAFLPRCQILDEPV